jgi:hypothetical protein
LVIGFGRFIDRIPAIHRFALDYVPVKTKKKQLPGLTTLPALSGIPPPTLPIAPGEPIKSTPDNHTKQL